MSITQGFCPKCGAPSENGELCGNCRIKDIEWVEIPERVECTICPTCQSVKTSGIWSDPVCERDELAYKLIESAIKFHKDVKNIQKSVNIRDISSNRSAADVLVTANLYGIDLEREAKIKIVWIREQCDRCCRISGSYYEGVIQVRAAGRKPDPFELHRAETIAYKIEEDMQNSGERLSFISDIDETKDGIDITFSSHAIGAAIAHDIIGALGGSFTTHPKLVGEKAGIRIYRVTYSIRLPRFSKGDIIKHENGYFRINRQIKDTLFVTDLKSGLSRTFREDADDSKIGNIRSAEHGTVIYKDAGILGIMDSSDSVIEAAELPWISVNEGGSAVFVRDGENIIIADFDESKSSQED